jgi:hypothetical protein
MITDNDRATLASLVARYGLFAVMRVAQAEDREVRTPARREATDDYIETERRVAEIMGGRD